MVAFQLVAEWREHDKHTHDDADDADDVDGLAAADTVSLNANADERR